MPEIELVLLAAGASSRMGSPKPLLPWGQSTLLENRVQTLQKINQPITIVLGSTAEQIIPLIKDKKIKILLNPNWIDGMSSSIAYAAKSLMQGPRSPDGILIMTTDQPLVDAVYLNQLLTTFRPNQKQIVVSQSDAGWKGIPVLFDKEYFQELGNISGDQGAKPIVEKYAHLVHYCKAGNKLEDMDTPERYQKMLELATNTNH